MPLAATMRPRSIGTRSSVALGACARTKVSKRSASAAWMSRKKNDGALSGSAAVNWRRRLPSISSTVTSSARPRPSDSTTVGVSAPGRWMLAIASRRIVRALPRRVACGHHQQRCDQPQHHENRGRDGDEDHRDLAVVGGSTASAASTSDRGRGHHVALARQPCSGATASRNSAETGTSCARPSGHSAKASAVSRP